MGNGQGVPQSLHSLMRLMSEQENLSMQTSVSTWICSDSSVHAADRPEGSCPREEEDVLAMKEHIGNASKDPVQTQIKDQCNMKLKI